MSVVLQKKTKRINYSVLLPLPSKGKIKWLRGKWILRHKQSMKKTKLPSKQNAEIMFLGDQSQRAIILFNPQRYGMDCDKTERFKTKL